MYSTFYVIDQWRRALSAIKNNTAVLVTSKNGTVEIDFEGTGTIYVDPGNNDSIEEFDLSTNPTFDKAYDGNDYVITITGDLSGITSLDAANQGIKEIYLNTLINLTTIRLQDNELTSIEGLRQCPSLVDLYFYNNSITSIDPVSVEPIKTSIRADSNTLTYNSLDWFTASSGTFRFNSTVTTTQEVDQFIIDIVNAGWNNCTVYLDGTNPSRTPITDFNIIQLILNNVGLVVNEYTFMNTTKVGTFTATFRGQNARSIFIDPGDGDPIEEVELTGDSNDIVWTHNYLNAGTKEIIITGDVDTVVYADVSSNDLTLINFDGFENLEYLDASDNNLPNLTSLQNLTTLITLYAQDNISMTGDVSVLDGFSVLEDINLSNNTSLEYTTTTLPAWDGNTYNFQDCLSTSAEIDQFIIDLADAGVNNCTITIDGDSPTRTGLSNDAMTTLSGNNVTVNVNEYATIAHNKNDTFSMSLFGTSGAVVYCDPDDGSAVQEKTLLGPAVAVVFSYANDGTQREIKLTGQLDQIKRVDVAEQSLNGDINDILNGMTGFMYLVAQGNAGGTSQSLSGDVSQLASLPMYRFSVYYNPYLTGDVSPLFQNWGNLTQSSMADGTHTCSLGTWVCTLVTVMGLTSCFSTAEDVGNAIRNSAGVQTSGTLYLAGTNPAPPSTPEVAAALATLAGDGVTVIMN